MRTIIATLLLSFFFITPTTADAASKADVQKVVELMFSPSTNSKVLLKEVKTAEKDDIQVVFVENGKRYTLWYSGNRIIKDDADSHWLAFWVRPDGTSGQESMITWTDNGMDGNVDFGIIGKNRPDSVRKLFREDKVYDFESRTKKLVIEGEEYRSHWQAQHDEAIAAALRHLTR